MRRAELLFDLPQELLATESTEARGIARDAIRLLVSNRDGHRHARFDELADYLDPGDLLVVNHSATINGSLPAAGTVGQFTLNLSTDYGHNLWLAEPRWSPTQPGPIPLQPGEWISVHNLSARMITPYPGVPRLWFVQFQRNVSRWMACLGQPIRYGYVAADYPLEHYQTIFAQVPGSAEMPSAARPFTPRVIAHLKSKGIELAGIVLHTGVSSLEVESDLVEDHPLYPEPFWVPERTARAINRARREDKRVVAVGTTVVRALESAWDGGKVRATEGFTRLIIHPGREVYAVDGLLTGFHAPLTSHLALLAAIGGQDLIESAYAQAIREGYLWHEFGDSHLILPDKSADLNV